MSEKFFVILIAVVNVTAFTILVIPTIFPHISRKFRSKKQKDDFKKSYAGTNPFATDKNDYINLYLRGVFQLAGYIGKCTDDQNPYRNAVVQGYIRKMATSPETAEICKTAFFAGCDEYYSPKQAARYFERYATYSRKKPNIRYMMNFIVTIALCDGQISEIEEKRLLEICDLLHFNYRNLYGIIHECRRLQSWTKFAPGQEDFSSRDAYDWGDQQAEARQREEQRKREEQRQQNYSYGEYSENSSYQEGSSARDETGQTPGDAFRVLGIPESASERQIKKAFHKLIRKYHPDLLKGRGLPEEMTQIYADKTRIINEAYETVRKYRNF
ncbi:DnaJ domain-containing protein [Succinimonas amylolytica]|uniref:DnaJ domain-containing protein n=1 Tax=Succinimonas amylolytica TaxID=83769 RepID=UPI000362F06C|nr:DnaJ domain-containing protein [Succinimonas amylolytica]